jgi:hypothetical protein
MGLIFSGDKLYFDELGIGISDGVTFDSNHHWDNDWGTGIHVLANIELVETYISNEILEIGIKLSLDTKENYANYINLMPLIPEKFRNSTVLQDFIDIANRNVGGWMGSIFETKYLLDPYSVGEDFIDYLAGQIGLTFVVNENTTLEDKRRQLLEAIDWYKAKGTYKSLSRIGFALDIDLEAYDLYTNDYVNFVREPWYAGDEGTNPNGLDASYYKSPHMGIDIVLNKEFGVFPDNYLFKAETGTKLISYVEKIRPVNVVITYFLSLYPETDTLGGSVTVEGNIQTIGFPPFPTEGFRFDRTDSIAGNFNDGINKFDATNDISAFTKWKLGTGNKGVSPDTSGFELENVVLTGTVNNIVVNTEKATFEILVPSTTTQVGISELGIFLGDNTTLKIASTFPDISIASGVTLRILVTLYFK